jgi:hypothetical protein
MRPGHGMDGVLHVDAALHQHLGQLAHAVLGLGYRHPVAGDDDDGLGAVEQRRRLLGHDAAHGALGVRVGRASSGSTFPKAPKITFIADRFMARHMMMESRNPDVPSSDPVMIWILFMSTKPMAAVGQARVRVEQRDHDRAFGRARSGITSRKPKSSARPTIE